jgi:hypothetical protein
MPYVLKIQRGRLDPYLNEIYNYYDEQVTKPARILQPFPYDAISKLVDNIEVNGDLNYCLSWLCWKIFLSNKRYATADKIIDVLEHVRLGIVSSDFYTFLSSTSDVTLEGILQKICKMVKPKLGSVLGTITCVQLEMYRRFIGPYEDQAILKNGDLEL